MKNEEPKKHIRLVGDGEPEESGKSEIERGRKRKAKREKGSQS